MSEKLVWVDCEMTGLDLVHDALIEVAVLVTDGDLNVLGEGVDLLIRPTDEALAQMGDYVRDMHTKSAVPELRSMEAPGSSPRHEVSCLRGV